MLHLTLDSLWHKNLHAGRSCHLHWQKWRGMMDLLVRFQSLSHKMLGTIDLPWIKVDNISSLRQSSQNYLGLNPTVLMDKCRWLKASWVALVPHQGYLFSCMLTVLSFHQGISSCPECKGNLDMNILVQTGIDARARYIILLPHWEEITLNIFRGEEKHTGGECMLIWKWKQSKTHHDLQMPTCGKKISVGTERKSSKLQKM